MKASLRAIPVLLIAVAVLVPATAATALPPGGTFNDDDGNIHEGYIEAIAADGITSGCNPPKNDRFCPDRAVTRGEMAAFLVRALGLRSDGGRDWFSDDNNSPFEDSINRLAAAGITNGCDTSDRQFCPNDTITREQMAAFLVRAYDLRGSTSGNPFSDDNNSIFEESIEILRANDVTKGCNPPSNTKFCPTSPVRRDEMATFLGRASGLTPNTPPPRVDVGDVDVHIYPGDDINDIVRDHGSGTIFMIHGEHHGHEVAPRDYQVFIGDDAVMDGDGWAEAAFESDAKGVQIYNIEIRDYDTHDWRGAVSSAGGSWLVENCEIHHNRTAGIWLQQGSPVVRNNYVHHNGRSGINIGYSKNGLVEGNEIAYNNYEAEWNWGTEAGGGKMWTNDGLVLRGNYSHHNHGPGLWSDHDNINIVYENNLIEDNYANGIMHEIGYDAVIRNNVIRRNGFGHDAWLWGAGIVIASSQNVEIYGNTIADNYNGIGMTQQNRGSGAYGEYLLRNNYAHNNTIIDSGLTGAAQDIGSNAIYSANIRFEGNSYQGDVGWHWMNGEVSWSRWQSYGHDD